MGSREWKMGASRGDRTQRYATSWGMSLLSLKIGYSDVYSGIMYQHRQGPAI